MMNAENDDQPSPVLLANSNSLDTNTNILLKPNSSSTTASNNLINEAFNLNSSSMSIQPLTVLPPQTRSGTSSLTHSRTPSFDPVKPPSTTGSNNSQTPSPSSSQTALKRPPSVAGLSTTASPFQTPPPLTQPPKTTLSSFFDQPQQQQQSLPPPSTTTAAPIQPPILLPPSAPPTTALSQSQSMPPPLAPPPLISTNIGPPLSMPPLQPTIPPPPISTPPTGGSSNPYAAKGALNKKVYDQTVVPTAAPSSMPPPSSLFSTPPPQASSLGLMPQPTNTLDSSSSSSTPGGLFMPPPPVPAPTPAQSPPTSSSTTFPSSQFISSPPPIFPSPGSPPDPYASNSNPYQMNPSNVNNIAQPIINLNERLTTSLSFGGQDDLRNQQQSNSNNYPGQPNKMWNWIGNVVEKAKSGVESIMTTVDPQMKDYIHPANRPVFLVSSIINTKLVHSIREAFIDAGFSKISQNAYDVQSPSQFAAQIVGFPCAMQSAKQKLDACLQMSNNADCIAFAFQDFVVELSPDSWFEMAIVMIKDRINNIELSIFTEGTSVSSAEIAEAQQTTPADYPFRWSGFAYKLRSHYSNLSSTLVSNQTNPYATTGDGIESHISSTRMSHALKTLALMYRARLIEMLR